MVDFIKRDKNDIFNRPILGYLFKNKNFLFGLRVAIASLFFYAVYFGFANPTKENIFTGAVFWGIFWALFMVVTLPTFGRIFCGICPHGFLGKYITKLGLKKTMPKWMQNRYIGIFILVIGWWGIYYTFPGFWKTPIATASMFAIMTIIVFVIYYLYKDMSYCKYVCPIGTLTRAYDKLAFTKLETYTKACKECKTFECATACDYNLKPFTFAKKNSIDDCTLCMDCANSCEAVKFKFTKPASKLDGKFKTLSAEVWTYILILASIPVTMTFAHGLDRSKIASDMIWNKTAVMFGNAELGGMFALMYAILFTSIAAVLGLWLASKVLKTDFKTSFTTLGYAYAPLFILGSLGHSLESFFTRGYEKIVEGFAQAFGFSVDVSSLASRGDTWLHYFGLLKWIGIAWALTLLYKRLKLIESSKSRKVAAYIFASFLIIFFISVNTYRGYVFKTYGAKSGGHMHGGNGRAMFQTVPFKDATLLQDGKNKTSGVVCGMNLPMWYKTNHSATLNGKIRQYCSIHCLAEDLILKKLLLKDIQVVDVSSLKFIDANKAFYVVGSRKKGTMSMTSKYAFASKVDAVKFSKKYGGEIVDFKGALYSAMKDFSKPKSMKYDDILYFSTSKPTKQGAKKVSSGHMHGGHGSSGGRPTIPTQKTYLAFGKNFEDKNCLSKVDGEFQAFDIDNKIIKVKESKKRGCKDFKIEVPNNGYYNIFYTQTSKKDVITYNKTAKLEYLRGRHGTDDVYDSSKMTPFVSTNKIDIIRQRDKGEDSFYHRHKMGDKLNFQVLFDNKPLKNAKVSIFTNTGWVKQTKTNQDGVVSFHIIKDYFPQWSKFDRRHKGDLLVMAEYFQDETKYSITYPAAFYVNSEGYKSYAYGTLFVIVTMILGTLIIYRYRANREKPFSDIKYEE